MGKARGLIGSGTVTLLNLAFQGRYLFGAGLASSCRIFRRAIGDPHVSPGTVASGVTESGWPSTSTSDLRREERALQGDDLEWVVQTVCRHDGVDRSDLSRRGSRNPARAALAILARKYTPATLADLVPMLGVSRPECVPNLTNTFSTWLEGQAAARQNLETLQGRLGHRNN